MGVQLRQLAIAIVLPALLVGIGGCVWAGYAASIVSSPSAPAVYVPARIPMLVVVKDAPDPSGMKIEADTVAREIERQFEIHHIVPLVPAAKVDEFRRTNLSGFATLPPAQIGRAVGAEQVLFVRIDSSSIDSGTAQDMLKGQISTTVSILDVKTGTLLWPSDGSNGAPVSFATPMLRITGQNTPLNVTRATYAGLADRIGKLFRKHTPG